MAMGKFGAFFNKDLSTLVKDAGKVLNADVGKMLNTDLGNLMKGETPAPEEATLPRESTPAVARAPAPTPAAPPAAPAPRFDPDATQKMTRMVEPATADKTTPVSPTPAATAASRPPPKFDPDATQKMIRPLAAAVTVKQPLFAPPPPAADPPATGGFDPNATQKMFRAPVTAAPLADNDVTVRHHIVAPSRPPAATAPAPAAPISTPPGQFNEKLLTRVGRAAPRGSEIKVLMPYRLGGFERPENSPAGELTNDAVTAKYAHGGDTVELQLALSWDADEALELVGNTITRVGTGTRCPPDRSWVFAHTSEGSVFAWTRGNYFFCAIAPKGDQVLERFLTDYLY